MNEQESRSGFVGLIGAPNVGKSTLLNLILGQKIAITSDKPQTTRHRILGIWTDPRAQIIFLDSPGIHQAKDLLNRQLVTRAMNVLQDADVILFVVDPGKRKEDEELVVEALREQKTPVILVINKIDLMNKVDLLPLIDEYRQKLPLAAIVPVSGMTGSNLPGLMKEIIDNLPVGPLYYPPETLTDQPERFIAAEMIREQVFRLTGQEIPYSTAVTVDEFDESREDLIRIRATIHLERDSQKKIVIGRGGQKLKEIGTAARREIERMTGIKVFLELFVRVQKNWSRDPQALRRFGYDEP